MKESLIFRSLYIAIAIIISMDFWSNINYLSTPHLPFAYIIFLCNLLLIIHYSSRRKLYGEIEVDKVVKWTIFTIFLSIIPAMIDYNQPFYGSFRECSIIAGPLSLYFVLRLWRFPTNTLIHIITIVCIIWVMLEIGQQFTYPDFWFSGHYITHGGVSERMGIYRFYIWGVDFVMLAYAYWLGKVTKSTNVFSYSQYSYLILGCIMLIGLLCYCSRKHMLVSLLVLVYSSLNIKGKKRILFILILTFLFFYLFTEYYTSLQELNMKEAEGQGEGEDWVRFIAANYFISEFSTSNLYVIFGAGLPIPGSTLATQLERLADIRIYQADVGVIGYYSKFGLLGVSAIIWYIYYVIKNWKWIDNWLKYFFSMKVILIIFDFWGVWAVGMMAYSVFLYLLEENVRKNKSLYYENRNFNIS